MSYFSEGGDPAGEVRIVAASELRALDVAAGIAVSPVFGDALNINVVVLEQRAVAAVHSHAEEQLGYVVTGTLEFTDGERTWTLRPGDCYHAPAGAPHGARALEERCVVIDAFSPPRAGLRELLEEG